jgi:uncharacterized RDD family membrane protein YckC
MRRTAQPVDDSMLFDLPLVSEPELANKPRPDTRVEIEIDEAEQISLPEGGPELESEAGAGPFEDAGETSSGRLQRRFVAGAIDAGAIAGALLAMVVGTAAIGIRPALADWPSYALVGLVLSFVYAVFSLLFWGKTPGMQRNGLSASSRDGSPLNIGQALLRWLGGICTVLLLGLPTLFDLRGGGTLTDRLSGSQVTT